MKVKHLIYIIALCFIVKSNIVYLPAFGNEAFSDQNLSIEAAKGLMIGVVDILIICAFIIHVDFTIIKDYLNKLMNKEI